MDKSPVNGELKGVSDLAGDVDDRAVEVEHGTGEELVLPNLLLAVKRFRFFSKPVLGSTVYHFGMVKQACISSQVLNCLQSIASLIGKMLRHEFNPKSFLKTNGCAI